MRAQPQAPHTQGRLEPLSTSSVCQLLLEMPLSGGSALVSNKLSDIRTRERPRRFQDLNAPPRLELTPESKYPTPPETGALISTDPDCLLSLLSLTAEALTGDGGHTALSAGLYQLSRLVLTPHSASSRQLQTKEFSQLTRKCLYEVIGEETFLVASLYKM